MSYFTKLNQYLSNLLVLNVKVHSLHWNARGLHFLEIHKFTQAIYEDLFEKYDAVAELLKMKGLTPLAKLTDYVSHASIQEVDPSAFSAEESIKILQEDLETMRNMATEIRTEADAVADFEIANEMEDHVAVYSKNLWFIRQLLG